MYYVVSMSYLGISYMRNSPGLIKCVVELANLFGFFSFMYP